MKELSIEDKAKRYDKAIKRAKDFMNGEVHYALRRGENIMYWIFPELKESEDEKIIKSFIRLLKAFYDVNFPTPEGFERKDMIAWIEKQGEQKSIEWSGKIDAKHAEGKLKEMLDRKEGHAWSEEDEENSLEKFKSLQHITKDLHQTLEDWGYAPSLYFFDGMWHVSWISCEDGDGIKDFEGNTPEEAIDKAFDWFHSTFCNS